MIWPTWLLIECGGPLWFREEKEKSDKGEKKKSKKKGGEDSPADDEDDDEGGDDDDVVWMTDTSAAAAKARAEEQLSAAMASMVTQVGQGLVYCLESLWPSIALVWAEDLSAHLCIKVVADYHQFEYVVLIDMLFSWIQMSILGFWTFSKETCSKGISPLNRRAQSCIAI